MGRHKDPDTLSFIEWLEKKGESLGFIVEQEYTLHKNEYFVDLVWKLRKDQDPLITFEIETKDSPRMFSNTAKIFGTTSKLVSKPWRHFIIIYKSKLSEGHKKSLYNIINLHNIFLFENILSDTKVKEKLEKTLESLAYDISELIKTQILAKPIGDSLPSILRGLSMGLEDGLIKDPETSISIRSRAPLEGGIKFTTITETPKGEPTFLDKLREARRPLEPVIIEAPQLKDLIINGKSVIPEGVSNAKIVITPTPSFSPVKIIVPETTVVFDEVLFRRVKTEGTMDYLSTEDRNLPFVFEFNLDQKRKNGGFHFKFERPHADVVQYLQFEELIRALNKVKELKIVDSKKNLPILEIRIRESLEQSNDWYDLISKLAYIQEKTKYAIPAPEKITKENVNDIYSLIRVINTGEEKGVIHDISIKIDKQGARNLIDVWKKQRKISSLELSQISYCKIFDENIPLGLSKTKLPDIQFVLPVEEVERVLEDTPDEGFIELTLKPITDNKITIRFENWPQKL